MSFVSLGIFYESTLLIQIIDLNLLFLVVQVYLSQLARRDNRLQLTFPCDLGPYVTVCRPRESTAIDIFWQFGSICHSPAAERIDCNWHFLAIWVHMSQPGSQENRPHSAFLVIWVHMLQSASRENRLNSTLAGGLSRFTTATDQV